MVSMLFLFISPLTVYNYSFLVYAYVDSTCITLAYRLSVMCYIKYCGLYLF